MRRLPLFGLAGARGEDPEIAIDLHRVGVDDHPAKPLGELERDGRLAARRRARDKQRAIHRPCRHASIEERMNSTRALERVVLRLK